MDDKPSRTGLLISALGGVALAIGVFLPWYGVSLTQAAVDSSTQAIGGLSAQYGLGNSQLASTFGKVANGLVGHEVFSLSAHQVFSRISLVLVIVGVIAALIALFALAQSHPTLPGNVSGLLVLGGGVAALLVLYRILTPPNLLGLLQLSTKPAAWMCLLGSIAIVAGALWPRERDSAPAADASVWAELSGWTPGA